MHPTLFKGFILRIIFRDSLPPKSCRSRSANTRSARRAGNRSDQTIIAIQRSASVSINIFQKRDFFRKSSHGIAALNGTESRKFSLQQKKQLLNFIIYIKGIGGNDDHGNDERHHSNKAISPISQRYSRQQSTSRPAKACNQTSPRDSIIYCAITIIFGEAVTETSWTTPVSSVRICDLSRIALQSRQVAAPDSFQFR